MKKLLCCLLLIASLFSLYSCVRSYECDSITTEFTSYSSLPKECKLKFFYRFYDGCLYPNLLEIAFCEDSVRTNRVILTNEGDFVRIKYPVELKNFEQFTDNFMNLYTDWGTSIESCDDAEYGELIRIRFETENEWIDFYTAVGIPGGKAHMLTVLAFGYDQERDRFADSYTIKRSEYRETVTTRESIISIIGE